MKSGQTVVEYVIAFAGLLLVCLLLWGWHFQGEDAGGWGLLSVVSRYATRTENLVSSEYP